MTDTATATLIDLVPAHLRGLFATPPDGRVIVVPIQHEGRTWLCLCDGRVFLAVPDRWNTPLHPETEERHVEVCRKLLTATPAEGAVVLRGVSVASLRDYCGPEPVSEQEPCHTCQGTREHTCPGCGEPHDCGACEGTGKQEKVVKPRQGLVAGVNVDLHRLRHLLRFVEGDCSVARATAKGPTQTTPILWLAEDGWLARYGWRAMLAMLSLQEGEQPEFHHA